MIFNLFKSKPTLKELIPNGFVDIHSHVLPGIDDGAKNIDQSLELINKMNKNFRICVVLILIIYLMVKREFTYTQLFYQQGNSFYLLFRNIRE